jgi:LPXTG-motif cell wall-anchored protein
MHASPDAPNVDIQVADGPVLFENVPFKEAFPYITVDAGTYDLEAAIHDSGDVALEVPGVTFSERSVYTVFAMGLAGGDPALQAVPSVDATPAVLPETGGMSPTLLIALIAAVAGVSLAGIGLYLQRKAIRA